MNKKGFETKIVNLIMMVIVIVLLLWLLKSQVLDSVDNLSDCEKSCGECMSVCGPGMDQLPKKCSGTGTNKGDVCCVDSEKLVYGTQCDKTTTETSTGTANPTTYDEARAAVNKQSNTMKEKAVAKDESCASVNMFDLKLDKNKDCQYTGYASDVDELNRLAIIMTSLSS